MNLDYLSLNDRMFFSNPYVNINALLYMENDVPLERVKKVLAERMPNVPRFVQHVNTSQAICPFWEKHENFSIDEHVNEITIQDPEEVRQTLMKNSFRSLDYSKPLWDLTLIHTPDGKSILKARIHHAVTDGNGLVNALVKLMDNGSELMGGATLPHLYKNTSILGLFLKTLRTIRRYLFETIKKIAQLASFNLFRNPPQVMTYKRESYPPVEVDWLNPPFQLDKLKAIGAKLESKHATVNDVILAIVSEALGDYFKEKKIFEQNRYRIRSIQPISIRSLNATDDMGNHVTIAVQDIEMGNSNYLNKLAAIHKSMMSFKKSLNPFLTAKIDSLIRFLPQWISVRYYVNLFFKTTFLISNVRGPVVDAKLAGAKIQKFVWFTPPFGNIPICFQALGYKDVVNLSITVDSNAITDIGRLSQLIQSCYQKLIN